MLPEAIRPAETEDRQDLPPQERAGDVSVGGDEATVAEVQARQLEFEALSRLTRPDTF